VTYRTTCPQCASIFRLGTEQLDAAQGWVQCSVCGAAFDARASLLLEDGSPLPTPIEPVESAPLEPVDAVAPAAEEPPPPPEAEPSEPAAAEAATPQGIVQREAGADLPSIILIDPDIPVPDDLGPLPVYPPTKPSREPAAPATPASAPAVAATRPPAARIEYAAAPPRKTRAARTARRGKPWGWAVAIALLLVVLLAQLAYFLRDTLVSQLPQLRPGLEQACAALGCTLSLPQNLEQLRIVGSDLQTEAKGQLKLTLTLGNRASTAQAWPVLVLTLTDQQNRPLARRTFAPSEYLDDSRRIADGMPPRSEQPLTLRLNVDDLNPMGFDLKLTY
jgi:predicted Zn finger-like uncharacterized protein